MLPVLILCIFFSTSLSLLKESSLNNPLKAQNCFVLKTTAWISRQGATNKISSLRALGNSDRIEAKSIGGKPVSPDILRSLLLTSANGEKKYLGELMGKQKAYANKWLRYSDDMRAANIQGPCFVSIGNSAKLSAFLENNPNINRDYVLVDDDSLRAYNSVGFGSIGENKELTIKGTAKMQAPELSASQWFSYLRSVGSLIPSTQGALKLGGTFAIRGNDVLYAYEDGVPGDHPDPKEVLLSFSQ